MTDATKLVSNAAGEGGAGHRRAIRTATTPIWWASSSKSFVSSTPNPATGARRRAIRELVAAFAGEVAAHPKDDQ